MDDQSSQGGISPMLVKAILNLQTDTEVYSFLQDLCTINELKSMSQRLDIAVLLSANVTFATIAGRTGASTATISRVNRCLNYGAGGYKKVVARLKRESEDEK